MTGIAASRMRGGPSPAALPHDTLTHVELTWVEKKIENWIRFGMHAHEQILDRRRRVLSFRPGTIFAFVRWASNDFGTIISRIDIVRAVSPQGSQSNSTLSDRRGHLMHEGAAGCPRRTTFNWQASTNNGQRRVWR